MKEEKYNIGSDKTPIPIWGRYCKICESLKRTQTLPCFRIVRISFGFLTSKICIFWSLKPERSWKEAKKRTAREQRANRGKFTSEVENLTKLDFLCAAFQNLTKPNFGFKTCDNLRFFPILEDAQKTNEYVVLQIKRNASLKHYYCLLL